MSHFLDRYTQYDLWIAHGEPKVIWLSGLHILESYLMVFVQTTCRAFNWPLDKVMFLMKVTEYTESAMFPAKLEYGIYIKGLYLEGVGWDVEKMCLKRQELKVLVVPLFILEMILSGGVVKLHGVFVTFVYVM